MRFSTLGFHLYISPGPLIVQKCLSSSGAQGGLFDEKTAVRQSRDAVPLNKSTSFIYNTIYDQKQLICIDYSVYQSWTK
jgi:hypothetical protein